MTIFLLSLIFGSFFVGIKKKVTTLVQKMPLAFAHLITLNLGICSVLILELSLAIPFWNKLGHVLSFYVLLFAICIYWFCESSVNPKERSWYSDTHSLNIAITIFYHVGLLFLLGMNIYFFTTLVPVAKIWQVIATVITSGLIWSFITVMSTPGPKK